jgi:spermidine/putrescine transport system ATP-binding protein
VVSDPGVRIESIDPTAAPSTSAIALRGVAKSFSVRGQQVNALEPTSLDVAVGEFFSLLGPSGCGKSTTLRIIAGFERPDVGEVLLQGKDVTMTRPARRDVNLVFQNYALFPHLTVARNVAYGLEQRKLPKSEISRRTQEMLEIVRLTGTDGRLPRELSGGQQQRVALARALVNRPSALLLDEPLAALDLKLREAMQVELKRIQREVGITFVYVTHDQAEALAMSDRICVMNNGRVEQIGAPVEVYERPASRFVAGFIGKSNVISGVVRTLSDEQVILDAHADDYVAAPNAAHCRPGEQVDITVRPEKIELSSDRGPGCTMRVTVNEVIYQGTSTNYTVSTRLGGSLVVYVPNSGSAARKFQRHEEIWANWHPQEAFVIGEADQFASAADGGSGSL